MSISILVSGAGIVLLGGTADASKLATGDPNKARKALDGSVRRLAGRALLVLVGGIEVQNVHIVQDFKVNQIGSRQCNESKMLCMNKKATMAVVD